MCNIHGVFCRFNQISKKFYNREESSVSNILKNLKIRILVDFEYKNGFSNETSFHIFCE